MWEGGKMQKGKWSQIVISQTLGNKINPTKSKLNLDCDVFFLALDRMKDLYLRKPNFAHIK